MFDLQPIFWGQLGIVLAVLALLVYAFNTIARNYLKVEKRKAFSYNHVNAKHEKIDWAIRIAYVIIALVIFFYQSINAIEPRWYFEIWFILLMFIIVSELARAFMEWKYSKNRKDYIFTLSQLVFILFIFGVLIVTDFLNLFNM